MEKYVFKANTINMNLKDMILFYNTYVYHVKISVEVVSSSSQVSHSDQFEN